MSSSITLRATRMSMIHEREGIIAYAVFVMRLRVGRHMRRRARRGAAPARSVRQRGCPLKLGTGMVMQNLQDSALKLLVEMRFLHRNASYSCNAVVSVTPEMNATE